MPRTKLPKDEIKGHYVPVRMTEEQFQEIKDAANSLGLSFASYLLSTGIREARVIAKQQAKKNEGGVGPDTILDDASIAFEEMTDRVNKKNAPKLLKALKKKNVKITIKNS